jgi:hypothetical protein
MRRVALDSKGGGGGANFNLVAPTHLTYEISALEINETLH